MVTTGQCDDDGRGNEQIINKKQDRKDEPFAGTENQTTKREETTKNKKINNKNVVGYLPFYYDVENYILKRGEMIVLM